MVRVTVASVDMSNLAEEADIGSVSSMFLGVKTGKTLKLSHIMACLGYML